MIAVLLLRGSFIGLLSVSIDATEATEVFCSPNDLFFVIKAKKHSIYLKKLDIGKL